MKTSQLMLLCIGLIAMLGFLRYLYSDKNLVDSGAPKPPPPPGVTPSPRPMTNDQPVKGQDSRYTSKDKDGRTQWEMHAKSIVFQDSRKRADAKDVLCTFFAKDSRLIATVVSKGVTLNTENQDLHFHGAVHAKSPIGETLLVQKLRYDGGRKRFFGSGGVKMTRGTSVVTGDRLVADPDGKTLEVKGNVQVHLHSLAPVAVKE